MASEAPFLPNERPPLRDEGRFAARELIQTFEQRKAEILASAASFKEIPNRAVAGDVADVVSIAQTVGGRLDARRKELTEPYRDAEAAVNATVNDFWFDVLQEIDRLIGLASDFRDAEKERAAAAQRQQEEERRRLREANAPKPSFPPEPGPDPEPLLIRREPTFAHQLTEDLRVYSDATADLKARPIRGSLGGKVSATKKITARVVDVTKVPRDVLEAPSVIEAIEKVARDLAKHRKEIDGIEITRGEQARIGR